MMKSFALHIRVLLIFISISFLSNTLSAQLEVEPTGTLFTPENLITNVFLGDGVEVTNISFQGADVAVGYFTNGFDDVGMDRGIVMATGAATTAATANNGGGTTGNNNSGASDPDMTDLMSPNFVNDLAIYEISFIPINDTLRFKYAWASEEYPEYACGNFNDAFGFFISGPGITGSFENNGLNIAFVPDPADPSGTTFTNIPVTINNVNSGSVGAFGTLTNCTPPNGSLAYGEYYNDNSGSTTLTYDGILDVFIAQVVVIPCEEYTIKLAVADAVDSAFDSAVFLEAKSFGTGSLEVEINTVSLDGTLAEGCTPGFLSFSLPNAVEDDLFIDYTIFGTAENGVDYEFIPDDLFIAAGDSSVSIPINVYEDGITEGIETLGIDVQRDPCNRDTFYLYITETELIPPMLQNDTTICQLESIQLDGTIDIELPPPPTFTNETDFPITIIDPNNPPPPGTPLTVSEIDVFSVQPSFLQDGVIKRICIDVDHNWISDVDAFLVSPGGQILELTTDNGAGGNDYIQTCFSPIATDTIDFGSAAPSSAAPFTGDWYPEGIFSDLWDGENPTNGTWQLQLKDDATADDGTLLGWSICFNPLYQINYSWAPSTGLSCDDCPDPIATPDETTTYVLTATDTYGCEVYDSITITVLETLDPPANLMCDVTTGSIDFSWDPIPLANGYEISLDGGMSWMAPIPGPLNHFIDGLSINEEVTIYVRGVGLCDGAIDSITCMTLDCVPADLILDDVTSLNCNGDTDGSITVSANGAAPPFTFMIADVDTNSTGQFVGLEGGVYNVLVEDDLGCVNNLSVEVEEPPAMLSNGVIIGNALCSGSGEGSATFDVSGGTAPYSFAWSNTSSDSIATALAVGEYYATITDGSGCSIIDTIAIVEPTAIELDSTSTAVTCNGNADGTATVLPLGGTSPYVYQWDANATDQTTQTATALSGGIYTVTVTDFQGCTNEISVAVSENTAIALDMSGTDPLCNNSADGTVTVVPNGGTGGNYTYSWSDPLSQNTATAIDLPQNTYTVIVTDEDGCTATDTYEITAPDELLTGTITETDATCNLANDGIITVEVSGGTYPYNFTWTDDISITDSTRTDLLAGTYEVVIADANGCSGTLNVTIGEPDALETSFNNNNVACNGGSTGSAMLILNGGTGPFDYQWDLAANNQTTQEATGLSAGMYSVTITDANSCTTEATTEIVETSAIMLSLSQSDVLCFGNSTGDISLDVNGGTTPYSFNWTGPNGVTFNQEDLSGLAAGVYEVVVTDDEGCTATVDTEILQPTTGIMPTMTPDDEICFGGTDGTATVTIDGGSGPYQYIWDNGTTTATVSNLDAGIHFVTITDAGSCSSVDTVLINERSQIFVELDQTAPDCFGGTNGSAGITTVRYNNTPANINDFNIIWSEGQSTPNVNNTLTGGETYSVTVTDNLGCTGEASITIDNPAEIGSAVIEENPASCFNSLDGSARVQGSGGMAPYNYTWPLSAGNQTSALAINLGAGEYVVTIADAFGCETTIPVVIRQPDVMTVDLNGFDESCLGSSDGSIVSSVDGGNGAYSYDWSNGSSTSDISNLSVGVYTVTVTDAKGCEEESQIELMAPTPLEASAFPLPVSCFDDEDGRIDVEATGGTAPYRYSLDGIDYTSTNTMIGLDAAIYTISILDANGCDVEIVTEVQEPPAIVINVSGDITEEVGYDPFQLNSSVSNNQGDYEITWVPPYLGSLICDSLFNDLNCPRPWVNINNTATFEAVVIDDMGCRDSDEVTVTITKFRPVFVPTAFTPNNDNENDRLMVHGTEGTIIKIFRVYDRWGELVFQAEDFPINATDNNVTWDGNFRSKEANPGTFIWYIEAEHIDGDREIFKGNTTLIR